MNNTELQTILDRLHELEAISLTTRTSAEQNELYDIVRHLRIDAMDIPWVKQMRGRSGPR
jgi:hypothetical protein